MFRTTRTTQNNRQKFDFRKVGVWHEKGVFLSHCSGFYFKNSILQNNVEQTQNNSEQLSEQVELPGTTGKSSIVVKEAFTRPKNLFFSSYNNGIQLIIWKNIQNNQNNIEQTAKVRFSQNRGLAQESVFFNLTALGVILKI